MGRTTIGRLASISGVNVSTIRFYEQIGLMPLPERTAGRHRNYSRDHLRRLEFIRRARELEFSLEEIKVLVNLDSSGRASCHEVRQVTAAHLHKVRKKLTNLTKIAAILAHTFEQCSSDRKSPCPMLDLLNARTEMLLKPEE
jgi:MerR family mercuric resistance operon transcriptional regulator